MIQTDFTPRMQQILLALLRETEAISVSELAKNIQVSKRTVQRELEYFPKALKKYHIRFASKTGTGVWLEGEAGDKETLRLMLEQDDTPDISNRSERRKRLVLEILKDKTLKKLYYYGELFGVSEATVSSDLEAVEGWFQSYGLQIVRKPGYGVFIEGSEKDFRGALRAFIDENLNSQMVEDMYADRGADIAQFVGEKSEKNIYHILDQEILKRVTACILRIRDKRILNLTENSYMGLVIHVTIAVNRILASEIIEENEGLLESLQLDSDYELAERIAGELETDFGIVIPRIEKVYICLHIKGAKVQQIALDEESRKDLSESRQLWDVVNEMIDCYDKDIAYLLKQDEEFVIEGLIAHLKPTLVRLANGMKIQNPLLEQIKVQYSEIYTRCLQVADVLKRHYGYEVPEAEIGFLAIHFGAAKVRLESRRESRRKVDLGIVCASGIGISRLLSSKIQQCFAGRVEVDTYGMMDLTPYVLEKKDFFVSTMPLKETADVIYVSPLLNQADLDRIRDKVSRYECMPKEKENRKFTRQLDQVNYMAVQIKTIIAQMGYLKVDPDITPDGLLEAISQEQTPYEERQLMIREDLLKRESINTQVFPEFGFALFHARTRGVMRPSFAVCVTREREAYTHPYFKGISAVVVMLLPMEDHVAENRALLGHLSETLVEEELFLETILGGGKEEVRELLEGYLKQFFDRYLDQV